MRNNNDHSILKMKLPTAHELAESIIGDIRESADLSSCETFSDLHDFCDANCLGKCEDIMNELLSHEETNEALYDARMEEWLCIVNTAQCIVNGQLPLTKVS